MAKSNKSTETLLVQLESLCTTDVQRNRYNDIESEHRVYKNIDRRIKTDDQRLYRVLHITRMLDTSLQLFLDIHGCRHGHSIGEYLDDLSRGSTPFLRLNVCLKQRFKEQIANVRNKYMHSSNQFPRENEINALTSTIHECLQAVLNLRICRLY